MIVVPGKIGTEIGWRGWNVRVRGERAFLYSVVHNAVWPAGEPMQAFCVKAHAAPDVPLAGRIAVVTFS